MRLVPIAYGLDSTAAFTATAPPTATAADRVRAAFGFLRERTNLRIAGSYDTSTGVAFHPVMADLWRAGWGLSIFDNFDGVLRLLRGGGGMDTDSDGPLVEVAPHGGRQFVRRSGRPFPRTFPTAAEGRAQADAVVARSAAAPFADLERAVIYIDNEDSNLVDRTVTIKPEGTDDVRRTFAGFNNLLDYYRAMLRRLEQQPPGVVRIRAGFYAHLNVATALLAEFPYLYICDAAYAAGKGNTQLDPGTTMRTGNRLDWIVNNHNAIPQTTPRNMMPPARQGRGPTAPWRLWPAVFQYEGDNNAALFPGRETYRYGATDYRIEFIPITPANPAGNWKIDHESSLVDDPAYPSVSPRIAATSGDWVRLALLDRATPESQQAQLPESRERTGMLRMVAVPERGQPDQQDPAANPDPAQPALVEPGVRPVWLTSPGKALVVSMRRTRGGYGATLQAHRLINGVLSPSAADLLDRADAPRAQTRWTGAACDDEVAAIFLAQVDGTLRVTRAAPEAARWPAAELVAARLVHPYSQLSAGRRASQSVDAFFIDGDCRLHTAWWDRRRARSGHRQIGTGPDELLPTTALSAVSPDIDANTVLVFGVGYDLQLCVAYWSAATGIWSPPHPVGAQDIADNRLCPHTDLAAAWNPHLGVVEVLAVTDDLRLCVYQLRNRGGWDATARRSIVFTPTSPGSRTVPDISLAAPNPYSDLSLAFGGPVNNRYRLMAAVFTVLASGAVPAGGGRSALRWSTSTARVAVPTPASWT